MAMNTRRCVFCSDLFRPRCRCGLTKYAMRRRTLREHRLELRNIWEIMDECGLAFEAKELIVGKMGWTCGELYCAPTLDAPSDLDSDPEEELKEALVGERALVEAVSHVQEFHRLHDELRRTRARVVALEAQIRSSESSEDQSLEKCPRRDVRATSRRRGSRKRTVAGETRTC